MLFAGVTATQITRICVTHFHGDHSLGLPGVIQRMSLDRIPHTVDAYFPAANTEIFRGLRHATLFHDQVSIREHPVEGGEQLAAAKDLTLTTRTLDHPVPTVGYRLTEPDGRRMLPEKLAEHGVRGPSVRRLIDDGFLTMPNGSLLLDQVSVNRRGQKFAFIMDTRLCDAAFELAEDADLLVCESTFSAADERLAAEYGHLTTAQAGRIASEAGARLLVLTHFSQRYAAADDDQRITEEAGTEFGGEIVVAHDLDRVSVPKRSS
jgi:ribonuclease Z